MRLDDLIREVPSVRPVGGMAEPAPSIMAITEDSRTAGPGCLFVARAGLKTDGRRYITAALTAGAAAILVDDASAAAGLAVPVLVSDDIPLATAQLAERFYGDPSRRLSVVGVTGTNGKTTTSFLVWQLLHVASHKCGLIGTVMIDDGRQITPSAMTTPPAIELSRLLAVMERSGCGAASMEISSHALDQRRADALRVRVAVFTNLSGDHLDYHKTMDQYARAKARLFERLDPRGRAIINADDPASSGMIARCRAPVWRTALLDGTPTSSDADCTAEIRAVTISGMNVRLRGPWGSVEHTVPMIGRYNAMNVLQAVAAAHALGLDRAALQSGLERLSAPPGRLEGVTSAGDTIGVYVDYAHSDDSLRNVLGTVGAAMPNRVSAGGTARLWAVFGCGGDRVRTKRPRMGVAAAELADAVLVTSDNPRTEHPVAIIEEILAGIPPAWRERVKPEPDRAAAIRRAILDAAPGDVVVIAGKGHETEQITPDGRGGTVRAHFDDREVARHALAERAAARSTTKMHA